MDKNTKPMVHIHLKSDMSEKVQYNIPEYPARIKEGYLSYYPGYAAISHWHDDIEFIVVLSGHMLYNINGKIVRMEEGQGIFVNARQIHYGYSDDHSDCHFLCILLHPMLLCSSPYIEQTYILPVTYHSTFEYSLLTPQIPWQRKIISYINEIYNHAEDELFVLKTQSLFHELWMELYKNIPLEKPHPTSYEHQLASLKDMIGYIQKHYKEKITLDEIARSGNVCKTNCCTLFQKRLGQTPIAYLIEYRLKKSLDLMTTSNLSLTEISFEVGFSRLSYYTETFHKHFGCSPTEYLKNWKK